MSSSPPTPLYEGGDAGSSSETAGSNTNEPAQLPSSPARPSSDGTTAAASPAPGTPAAATSTVQGSSDANGGDEDDVSGSPQRGSSSSPADRSPGGASSPIGSAPPTPLSDFSPPRSLSGSIPRTPSSMGGRSLPGTPRTPFTPMDMQVRADSVDLVRYARSSLQSFS